MREKLMTLSAAELKELARSQGIKGYGSMRKADLVEQLAARWEMQVKAKEAEERAAREKAEAGPGAGADAKAETAAGTEAAESAAAEEKAAGHAKAAEEKPAGRGKAADEKPAGRGKASPGKRAERTPRNAGEVKTRRGRAAKAPDAESPEGTEGTASPESSAKKVPARRGRRPAERPAAAGQRSAAGSAAVREEPGAAGSAAANEERSAETRSVQPAAPAQPRPVQPQAPAQPRPVQPQAPAQPRPVQPQAASPMPRPVTPEEAVRSNPLPEELQSAADGGPQVTGILEVMQDGYGFIRSANYMSGDDDVYVSPSQIRRFCLRTGDMITGIRRIKTDKERYAALLYVSAVNGLRPADVPKRKRFEDMTPIFPNRRIHLEKPGASLAMRVVDLVSPIGKGQRGMIVSPPKAGKTTLLKEIARTVTDTDPDMHLIILLIDERPEEVTDIREYIEGPQVEVIYSTFDCEPEQHKRVSEMVIERAKRLVEQHRDVMILLDSITRLARAYNLTVVPSGRTLSGGLDPAALYMPKRFFGAARNMREGGSLTILATALVDTGSRMDDVVYEEFKGTGNMELVLDRKLSERRICPAVDILKSGTRRDDLLLAPEERIALDMIHRATNGARPEESLEKILDLFSRTPNNTEFIRYARMHGRF